MAKQEAKSADIKGPKSIKEDKSTKQTIPKAKNTRSARREKIDNILQQVRVDNLFSASIR